MIKCCPRCKTTFRILCLTCLGVDWGSCRELRNELVHGLATRLVGRRDENMHRALYAR